MLAVIASAAGAAVAITLSWAAFVASEKSAGRDAEADRAKQIEKFRCVEGVLPDGGTVVKCLKMKSHEVRAGLSSGLILRDCGTQIECGTKCPDLWPPEQRCAVCDAGLCIRGSATWAATPCDAADCPAAACDPDEPDCRPWPCTVYMGDLPSEVASEVSDGGSP